MTKFWVSFILKFSPSNWKTCEKCQNFNHHKIEDDSSPSYGTTFQKCHFVLPSQNSWGKPKLPKLPPSKVTSVGWGTWIFIYQMGKAKYKFSKGKKVYNVYRLQ
jgi:hypothetical protein